MAGQESRFPVAWTYKTELRTINKLNAGWRDIRDEIKKVEGDFPGELMHSPDRVIQVFQIQNVWCLLVRSPRLISNDGGLIETPYTSFTFRRPE